MPIVPEGASHRPPRCPIHSHDDDGGIVEIWVMRIGILERPAAWTHARAAGRPVADSIKDLPGLQPFETAPRAFHGSWYADLEKCVRGERRIPHRRHARLAIRLVLLDHQKLVERGARSAAI